MNTSHYPSLELCKKLRDIGFPKTEYALFDTRKSWKEYNCVRDDSDPRGYVFVPFENIEIGNVELEFLNNKEWSKPTEYNDSDGLICPSVMEMLDVMPDHIILPNDIGKGWKYAYQLLVNKRVADIGYDVFYNRVIEKPLTLHWIEKKPLPNALAEMILWLHDNKHLNFQNGN